jgi:hypothetical protein
VTLNGEGWPRVQQLRGPGGLSPALLALSKQAFAVGVTARQEGPGWICTKHLPPRGCRFLFLWGIVLLA